MNAVIDSSKLGDSVPTVIGTPFEGGYYGGIFTFGGDVYANIVSSKALGEFSDVQWGKYGKLITGADSFFDGLANTLAMAESGSEIAQRVLDLRIAGRDDWHIGARDIVEMQYRHFKPTAADNYVYRHGENPGSLPVGYPYTVHFPGQTPVDLFREGGPEAFEAELYWTSTQSSAYGAWLQYFSVGCQDLASKNLGCRVRAVRRLKIS